MYYLIPAWYGQGAEFWQPDLTPWYFRTSKIEFDDTLHQARIFQGQAMSPRLLLLAYQPHLRYFLHRFDLLEVSHFSVFDAIQGIKDQPMRCLQVSDLDWDDDCDFIFTPFIIVVEKHHQRFAEIELGPEGYLSLIRYYQDGLILREEIYDDRGFVSSILHFENGQATHRDYLNEDGIWQLCHFFDGRGIVSNPRTDHRFKKNYYISMEEVIWEFFDAYIAQELTPSDCFVVASKSNLNQTLYSHLPEANQKILTYFKERNQNDPLEDYASYLQLVDLIISDSQDFSTELRKLFPEQAEKIQHMASYDTRLALGKSQRLKSSKLYYQVNLDDISWEAIYQVLDFVANHQNTHIVFGTFNANPHDFDTFKEEVEHLISEKLNKKKFKHIKDNQSAENYLAENEEVEYRYDFVNLIDETALIKEFEYTRLIVDLSLEPHRYTQIAGISAGIPQINRVTSDYVTHLKNGYILEEVTQFEEASSYYLDQLKYWNQALIEAIEKIRENTGERFVEKWEHYLKEDKYV